MFGSLPGSSPSGELLWRSDAEAVRLLVQLEAQVPYLRSACCFRGGGKWVETTGADERENKKTGASGVRCNGERMLRASDSVLSRRADGS